MSPHFRVGRHTVIAWVVCSGENLGVKGVLLSKNMVLFD